jgi:hypothetical protein
LRSIGGLAAYFVTLFLILFLGYNDMASYTHLHSLQIAGVTYHLGYISYLDGGASTIYLLCDQDQKNAVCTTSFSECGIEDLTLAKSSRTDQLIVQWQSQIAYVYDIPSKQLHRNEEIQIPCW